MRIVRFLCNETKAPAWGVQLPSGEVHFAHGDPFDGGLTDTEEVVKAPQLLAPLQPAAILCIGLNYAAHAAEGGRPAPERPVLFMKTPSAVQHPGGPIVLPRRLRSTRVDYEAELAIVIGKPCKNVSRADALEYVLGYTCGNDVSARDWQRNGGGGQWCRGKTFDTFAPLGPALVTTDELRDAGDLRVTTTIGGELLQDSRTSDMIFSVPKLIEFLSASVTLAPGTVILSGTPEGVGFARTPPRWLEPGDEVTVEIEGIGKLTNPVVEEEAEELTEWTLKDE
ncbi:fumarylacetoacetate hydrolase family protein [Botrimarina mediterranea]|uniref:Ureidoglycolate lyase n=1 Tax=Botrimarina mediterranea TaxID=2528022 RepID=A0A518K5R5_9BACT|nr:fumarylacetoacetate hydrolase family protein [Botrimarina mediterranea]QDV73126.1 Ureidoglycolate lyase [Botrimarina mediterranea]QDV77699.1 Ureidoglycolate lyase [Planctomycetes bacterium K2D]